MQVDAFGSVHVPAVPDPLTTHFAGVRHGGPTSGLLSQGDPSAAESTHAPVGSVSAAFLHNPLLWQTAKPVMGALPMSPHAAFGPTNVIFWHVPIALPLAVGMHTSPMSTWQLAIVFRVPSHAVPTVAPEAWHVPFVIVASSSPTHENPDWQGS
jgi:hypothetical protein